jgi:2'-5' RNA ligase
MRLFTALDPPGALCDALVPLQSVDALPVRWTARAQFHVTLRFIGEVDASAARRVGAALRHVEGPAPQCVPYGLDALPSRRTARVLVVGMERTDSLMALYEAVSSALEAEGLPPDERAYRPHITLGRLEAPSPKAVHAYLHDHQPLSLPAFRGERMVLYKSTPTPDGALYAPQATYPLVRTSG